MIMKVSRCVRSANETSNELENTPAIHAKAIVHGIGIEGLLDLKAGRSLRARFFTLYRDGFFYRFVLLITNT